MLFQSCRGNVHRLSCSVTAFVEMYCKAFIAMHIFHWNADRAWSCIVFSQRMYYVGLTDGKYLSHENWTLKESLSYGKLWTTQDCLSRGKKCFWTFWYQLNSNFSGLSVVSHMTKNVSGMVVTWQVWTYPWLNGCNVAIESFRTIRHMLMHLSGLSVTCHMSIHNFLSRDGRCFRSVFHLANEYLRTTSQCQLRTTQYCLSPGIWMAKYNRPRGGIEQHWLWLGKWMSLYCLLRGSVEQPGTVCHKASEYFGSTCHAALSNIQGLSVIWQAIVSGICVIWHTSDNPRLSATWQPKIFRIVYHVAYQHYRTVCHVASLRSARR
jgi:hypothetical protein